MEKNTVQVCAEAKSASADRHRNYTRATKLFFTVYCDVLFVITRYKVLKAQTPATVTMGKCLLLPYRSLKFTLAQFVKTSEKPGYSVYMAQYSGNGENSGENNHAYQNTDTGISGILKSGYCVYINTDKPGYLNPH